MGNSQLLGRQAMEGEGGIKPPSAWAGFAKLNSVDKKIVKLVKGQHEVKKVRSLGCGDTESPCKRVWIR